MSSIVTLGPNDIGVASDLLATSFEDDFPVLRLIISRKTPVASAIPLTGFGLFVQHPTIRSSNDEIRELGYGTISRLPMFASRF